MNNATALHLLHQVREGERSCFGEVTLTKIKLLVSDARTHGLPKKSIISIAILLAQTHNGLEMKHAYEWTRTQ